MNRDRYRFFFAREGKWDAQTMLLLSFAISARNVPITQKNVLKVLFGMGGGGGGGYPPLYQSLWQAHGLNLQ